MSRFNLFSKKLVDLVSESTHTSCESNEFHPSTTPNPKPQEV